MPYNGLAPALMGVKDKSVQACTLPYTALVKNMDGKDLHILAVQRAARGVDLSGGQKIRLLLILGSS